MGRRHFCGSLGLHPVNLSLPGGANAIVLRVAAVPEPAAWALMLMDLGAVGYGLRSRRRATTGVRYT